MKIEARHAWQAQNGLTLRERVVASLPRWAPLAARVPALLNVRQRGGILASLAERVLGFSARRSLPRWRSDTYLLDPPPDDPDPDVVLLVDTFTNAFEPENAADARTVLRAAGYRVAIARASRDASRPLCCGRTLLTAGLVDDARAEARRLSDALLPHARRGAAIVGLEPSCLFTLRDEFAVLGLGDDAGVLAARAFMVDEFLDAGIHAGRAKLRLGPLPQARALVHGHCHQKAFDTFGATLRLLGQVPGLAVHAVESSCCGMAGSFGYEAEHYDASMAMAELALLPAVRAAAEDTLIVAAGTSCRHQIADGTQGARPRDALHPIRVVARALSQPTHGAT